MTNTITTTIKEIYDNAINSYEKITTVKKVEKYKLKEDLYYILTIIDNKEVSRELLYTGGELYGYPIYPIYKEDLSLMRKTNPFWNNYEWFTSDILPDVCGDLPSDFDLKKVIYVQNARHICFDSEFKPLPIVRHGDYIECHRSYGRWNNKPKLGLSDKYYDLTLLREQLLKNDKIVSVSKIFDIPWYNATKKCKHYLDINYIADSDFIQKELSDTHFSLWIGDTINEYLDINNCKIIHLKFKN
jgi:hypothetical protein